ncbi:unnamed protein product, partial [Ectocarpus sp. 12 AP-2014]
RCNNTFKPWWGSFLTDLVRQCNLKKKQRSKPLRLNMRPQTCDRPFSGKLRTVP